MSLNLFRTPDGKPTGISIANLEKSAENKNALIALFNGAKNIPSSVMEPDKSWGYQNEDQPGERRNYSAASSYHAMGKDTRLPKAVRVALSCRGKGAGQGGGGRSHGEGGLSRFPQNIGRSMVLMYSKPSDVVFDPFAGHNSRMEFCIEAGRSYIGCDLSSEFMEFNRARAKELREKYPGLKIKLIQGDSRSIPVKSGRGDFTITSPPYWDIEYYGDEPEQLGKSKTYADFMQGLQQALGENHRILKPGSFAVWFVNDFRKNGTFYLYHIDTIRAAEAVGFVVHDLLIVNYGRTIRDCFINRNFKDKLLPKRHEYGLIFRKPLK